MGQGNPAGPAPPKGWLKLSKPKQNHGISHRFQLVQDFAGPSTVSPSNPIRYLLISLALMVDMALLLHPNMSNIYIYMLVSRIIIRSPFNPIRPQKRRKQILWKIHKIPMFQMLALIVHRVPLKMSLACSEVVVVYPATLVIISMKNQ